MATEDFTWRDGERTIRFADGALGEAPALIAAAGLEGYTLLTTERAAASAPDLKAEAESVVHVPPGQVDEVSAALLDDARDRPLVALGGGRVVDTAKAIAGAQGSRCAAVPTSLSGAPMTPFHRTPEGVDGARLVRPALVIADPAVIASQPHGLLGASAMNALAHAMEALYTPLVNPVAEYAALRAAELIGAELPRPDPDRGAMGLAALLAGYAAGSAGIAIHHATCQTIVRTAGAPHAETNAVMLPHFAGFMAQRAYGPMGAFAAALGDPEGDPATAAAHVARLAARSMHTRLSTLGVDAEQLPAVARATLQHPAVGMAPEPPDEAELLALLRAAL